MNTKCTRCGGEGHLAQDHAWDPELRAQDRERKAAEGIPFCEPCGSWHPVPTDPVHHAALQCKAPPPACKGKVAACVLRDVLMTPDVLAYIEANHPELADHIVEALVPFNGKVLPPTAEVIA